MNPTTAIAKAEEAVATTSSENNRHTIVVTPIASPASRRKREIHAGLGATTSESTKRPRKAFRPAIRRNNRKGSRAVVPSYRETGNRDTGTAFDWK